MFARGTQYDQSPRGDWWTGRRPDRPSGQTQTEDQTETTAAQSSTGPAPAAGSGTAPVTTAPATGEAGQGTAQTRPVEVAPSGKLTGIVAGSLRPDAAIPGGREAREEDKVIADEFARRAAIATQATRTTRSLIEGMSRIEDDGGDAPFARFETGPGRGGAGYGTAPTGAGSAPAVAPVTITV